LKWRHGGIAAHLGIVGVFGGVLWMYGRVCPTNIPGEEIEIAAACERRIASFPWR
jgi:hypothetical protein